MHDSTARRRAKSAHLFIGAVLSLSSLTCAERGEEAGLQSVRSALTSTSYEAEALTRTASAAGSKVTSETGASAGAYVQFTGTAVVGDWIQLTLPNVVAGTYDVAMLYKSNTNRAIVQASIDGVDQGPSCDQYASTPAFQVRCSLGTATLSAGNHLIRFKVIGKRSSSTSYLEVIDQISLGVSGGGTGGTGGAGGAGGTVAYAPCPTNGNPCKILPFGDSITEGVRSSDGAGYRSQLFKLIVAASQKVTFTGSLAAGPTQVSGQTFPRMHEGHAGWTIDPGFSEFPNSGYGGISSLVPSPALNGSPHIVLLHIGANELFPTHDGVGMATRLDALVEKIATNAPSALIVLAQITPVGTSNNGHTQAQVDAANAAQAVYNSRIPGIIQAHVARGQHVIGVDMSKMPLNDLTTASVHPNDQGYAYMAGIWYPAIKNLLPK